MSEIIKQFNNTGPCIIDIDVLAEKWDHRFLLSQWQEQFKLVQYLRRGSAATKIKCAISIEQAKEIIDTLKLEQEKSGIFTSGSTWRKVGQSEFDMQRKPKFLNNDSFLTQLKGAKPVDPAVIEKLTNVMQTEVVDKAKAKKIEKMKIINASKEEKIITLTQENKVLKEQIATLKKQMQ